jgi:hypothetical protein
MEQGLRLPDQRATSFRKIALEVSLEALDQIAETACRFVRANEVQVSNTPSTYPATTPGKRKDLPRRSSSNGGFGLLVRLPSPRQQVGDYIGGVIWKLSSTSASQACGSTSFILQVSIRV